MRLRSLFARSPAAARVLPFLIFVFLTSGQGLLGEVSTYWIYLAKTLVGIWLAYEMRGLVPEIRWTFSFRALGIGVLIFVIWVGISGDWTTQTSLWNHLGWSHGPALPSPEWDPWNHFGHLGAIFFIVVRILGSSLVVPPIEEAFYRSFLYRYVANPDFLKVPLTQFLPVPFLLTAMVFGLSHNEWAAAIICGMAYQWLVLRCNHLGEAMTAHGITNFLLGAWVVWRHAWQFW